MPRYPRLFLPDMPLHIVQRGHDQQPVFNQRADYEYYLFNLFEAKSELAIAVYAYCLMTNHVHLVLAPGQEPDHISKLIKILAARQTRHVNKLESRSGTLWEGRFKASLIETDAYLLSCYRYVELNPVRAAMVSSPADYEWSSYRRNAAIAEDTRMDTSSTYQALGSCDADRAVAYRNFVAHGVDDSELDLIRTAVKRNQLTATSDFRQDLARRTGRHLSARGQGRPKPDK